MLYPTSDFGHVHVAGVEVKKFYWCQALLISYSLWLKKEINTVKTHKKATLYINSYRYFKNNFMKDKNIDRDLFTFEANTLSYWSKL